MIGVGALGAQGRLVGAARTGGYLVPAVPLGLLTVLSLPLALVGSTLPWRLATQERQLANAVLHARVPQLPERGTAAARRLAATSPLRLGASAAAAAVVLGALALTVATGYLAVEGLFGPADRYLGPWTLGFPAGAVLAVLAVAAAVVTLAVLDGLARPLREVSRRLLVPVAQETVPVREALAESIGDAGLSIAYWLPDREAFVDEHGLPVVLPEPGSGRMWTAVEHEGRRVAAIVHDADLDAGPELVQAASAGAVMALENERLNAALRARVEELRSSRARIVGAGIEARRQLERDLHDGAQQHLVALSLELQMLRTRVSDEPETLAIVESSIAKLASALEELRELARGIHPAILTHRGLGPAITALVERTQLPVEWQDDLRERVSPAAEAAGYFVVLEALTNVLKYAAATRVAVRVRRDGDAIVVEVEDDGVGGANAARGSGLRGLEDRVAALEGTLSVDSPPAGGTRVTARIPAGAD